jgi:hypothetical protein
MVRSTPNTTQDDIWTGSILIRSSLPSFCEYKYIIADWDSPRAISTLWEGG